MKDTYYEQVKEKIIDTETTVLVKDYSKNRVVLENYFEIGRLLVKAQGGLGKNKYGNKIIKDYAIKLTNDFGAGYSWRNLYNMRQYYIIFSSSDILYALRTKLSWTHYRELLSLNNPNEIEYYIDLALKNSFTYRQLHERIKKDEYKNLSEDTKQKLIERGKPELVELIKNPIMIHNPNNLAVIKENILKKLILEDIENFMKELGNSFSFIGSEYKIKIGDKYNYIDLLLFNYEYNCFVVVELKVTELKKEHLGQIQVYMNYIDNNLRRATQDKTIGIIICKKDNQYVISYCSDDRIISRAYELVN